MSLLQEQKFRSQIFSVLSGMWPVLTLDEREELFFEASFVVFHHDFITYYIPFRK